MKKYKKQILLTIVMVSFILLPVSLALSQVAPPKVELQVYYDQDLSNPVPVDDEGIPIVTEGTFYLKFSTKDYQIDFYSIKLDETELDGTGVVEEINYDPITGTKIYKSTWNVPGNVDGLAAIIINGTVTPEYGGDLYIDNSAPTLKSIRAINNNKIELFFDDVWMDANTVKNVTYYSIFSEVYGTLGVTDVLATGTSVRIFTYNQVNDAQYYLEVSRGVIKDAVGKTFIASNNVLEFTGTSALGDDPHGYYSKNTSLCATCHATHKSEGQYMMTKDINTVCFLCHDSAGQSKYDIKSEFFPATPEEAAMIKSKHPVEDDITKTFDQKLICSDCHDVHGGRTQQQSKLLRSYKYVNGEKIPYYRDNAFCFSCHGKRAERNTKIRSLFLTIPDYETYFTRDLADSSNPSRGMKGGHAEMLSRDSNLFPRNNYNIDCLVCHSGYNSSLDNLINSSINGSNVNESEKNSICMACHQAKMEKYKTENNYFTGFYPGKAVYENSYNKHNNSPIIDGSCKTCHEPHGTQYGKMLVERYTFPIVTDNSAENFSLCFNCHDGSSGAANIKDFYDGQNEGHRIVQNNGNGFSKFKDINGNPLPTGWKIPCTDCHNPHGNSNSNQEMLSDQLNSRIGVSGLWSDTQKKRVTCFACHKPSDEEGEYGRSYRGAIIGKLRDLTTVTGSTYDQHSNNSNNPVYPQGSSEPQDCLSCHGGNAHNPVKIP